MDPKPEQTKQTNKANSNEQEKIVGKGAGMKTETVQQESIKDHTVEKEEKGKEFMQEEMGGSEEVGRIQLTDHLTQQLQEKPLVDNYNYDMTIRPKRRI